MSRRITKEELDGLLGRTPKPRSKMRNKITEVDEITFHSKKEADYYTELKLKQKAGIVRRFHRQVIFDLPGGTKYTCDFQVFFPDRDEPEYVDVKGYRTPEFIRSKKQVRAIYDVEIVEV